MLVTLQWDAPASQQMCLPAQALPQATVPSLVSCRGISRLHLLNRTIPRPWVLFNQLRRERFPLQVLRKRTLLLRQLQKQGRQASSISQKAHPQQRQ